MAAIWYDLPLMHRLRMPSGLHPFLFAAYAVLFLYSQNLAEVSFRDAIPPLGRAIIGAGLATIVPALLLRDLKRGAIVGSALVAAFYGYGHLSTLLEEAGHGTDVLHALLIGLLVIAVILAIWLRRRSDAGPDRRVGRAGRRAGRHHAGLDRSLRGRPRRVCGQRESQGAGRHIPAIATSIGSSSTATGPRTASNASPASTTTSPSGWRAAASTWPGTRTRTTSARRCRWRRPCAWTT